VHRSLRASVFAPILAGVLAASAIAFAGVLSVHGTIGSTQQAPKHLRIRGHVKNLEPGRVQTLIVRVHNPLSSGVVVHRLRATVHRGQGDRGRCPAKALRIRRWHGVRRIPAGESRRIHLTVRIRRAAPARCLGTRWPIHYVARSVRR
jgi:hypothetical protein